jgi:hypothetical protein
MTRTFITIDVPADHFPFKFQLEQSFHPFINQCQSLLYVLMVIIPETPGIFGVLDRTRTVLLYRGSQNGLSATDFHEACDGHSNTVTIVFTSDGFIFGRYSSCSWDSSETFQQDDTLKSFLFSLKNPHGRPASGVPFERGEKKLRNFLSFLILAVFLGRFIPLMCAVVDQFLPPIPRLACRFDVPIRRGLPTPSVLA